MSEQEEIRAQRRDLGRQLAAARKQAGYAQREFARRISYARSTVSTVESGVQHAGRPFWEACDDVLRTGGTFARGYDQIRAQQAAVSRPGIQPTPAPGEPDNGLRAPTVAEALRAYQALGWPTVADGGIAALVTGTVLDALEVPRVAGMLAACWWRCTGGLADEIRGLPRLPDPQQALIVIACADRFFFLTAAGSCPWAGQDLAADPPRTADTLVIGWHSSGSRILAPPSVSSDAQQATWAYLPPGRIRLACPVVLLHLLAKAAAATQHPQAVSLPGGVLAVPVPGSSPRSA